MCCIGIKLSLYQMSLSSADNVIYEHYKSDNLVVTNHFVKNGYSILYIICEQCLFLDIPIYVLELRFPTFEFPRAWKREVSYEKNCFVKAYY